MRENGNNVNINDLNVYEDRIKAILIQIKNVNGDVRIDSNKDLVQDYNLNSVDALELLMFVEQEFGVEIPDEDLNIELVRTVEYLASYIYKLHCLSKGSSPKS